MTQRSEHGGGEASIRREALEAMAYNEEKRNRRIGKKAVEAVYIPPATGDLPYSRDVWSPKPIEE